MSWKNQFNDNSNFSRHARLTEPKSETAREPGPFGTQQYRNDTREVKEAAVKTTKPVPFADWADRLNTMANEAQDEDLLALESDLLDLRDEIRKHG